jgi:hypothetical protein
LILHPRQTTIAAFFSFQPGEGLPTSFPSIGAAGALDAAAAAAASAAAFSAAAFSAAAFSAAAFSAASFPASHTTPPALFPVLDADGFLKPALLVLVEQVGKIPGGGRS